MTQQSDRPNSKLERVATRGKCVCGEQCGGETTNNRKPRATIDFVARCHDQIPSRDVVAVAGEHRQDDHIVLAVNR